MPSAEQVRAVAEAFPDPESGRGLSVFDQVRAVEADGEGVRVRIGLTSWAAPIRERVLDDLRNRIVEQTGVEAERCVVEAEEVARPAEKLGQIGLTAKSVVAVGSGKGGVGKSTIAASVALGLREAGSRVGLMDADVYGPSVPHLLGVDERPTAVEKRLQPIDADGLKVMSMGLMVPPGEAVVWRGPMLHGAITQMLRDTDWGDLDYLIIDMPPGTGDVALTLSQLLPLTGAVVVCTPQDVALLDAVKALAMFRKVKVPVLGVVENMSSFVCTECGATHAIFSSGGAKQKAAELAAPFLGEAPINIELRKLGDDGRLAHLYDDAHLSEPLAAITRRVVEEVVASRGGAPAGVSLPVL